MRTSSTGCCCISGSNGSSNSWSGPMWKIIYCAVENVERLSDWLANCICITPHASSIWRTKVEDAAFHSWINAPVQANRVYPQLCLVTSLDIVFFCKYVPNGYIYVNIWLVHKCEQVYFMKSNEIDKFEWHGTRNWRSTRSGQNLANRMGWD